MPGCRHCLQPWTRLGQKTAAALRHQPHVKLPASEAWEQLLATLHLCAASRPHHHQASTAAGLPTQTAPARPNATATQLQLGSAAAIAAAAAATAAVAAAAAMDAVLQTYRLSQTQVTNALATKRHAACEPTRGARCLLDWPHSRNHISIEQPPDQGAARAGSNGGPALPPRASRRRVDLTPASRTGARRSSEHRGMHTCLQPQPGPQKELRSKCASSLPSFGRPSSVHTGLGATVAIRIVNTPRRRKLDWFWRLQYREAGQSRGLTACQTSPPVDSARPDAAQTT